MFHLEVVGKSSSFLRTEIPMLCSYDDDSLPLFSSLFLFSLQSQKAKHQNQNQNQNQNEKIKKQTEYQRTNFTLFSSFFINLRMPLGKKSS